MASNSSTLDWSIVAPNRFIRATRDSGYRSTASAVSELVDNAIQAGARNIEIHVEKNAENKSLEVTVADNGCGMDPFTLRQALRFGGSSRFNDRSGLGRFGMGLPNSSLSQARHVTVTSWRHLPGNNKSKRNVLGSDSYLQTYLDVDEIADGRMVEVPVPHKVVRPKHARKSASGTVVRWTQCDRLDYRRAITVCKHIKRDLSQRFRFFIQSGTTIRVNRSAILAFDPTFLSSNHENCAVQYGNDIQYTVASDPDDPKAPSGVVRVRFSELPVTAWAGLSNSEKRTRRIVQNAGASIVRANREVDYGWTFFGSKRKENYDDWWRCEIHFDPILDEAFGLTHTKQQVKPKRYLLDAVSPDLEAIARTLNTRAREAHAALAVTVTKKRSEAIVDSISINLKPLGEAGQSRQSADVGYRIELSNLEPGRFFGFQQRRGEFVLTLDPDHAFYREFYGRYDNTRDRESPETVVELLLFSAARAEAMLGGDDRRVLAKFRREWGKTFEALLSR